MFKKCLCTYPFQIVKSHGDATDRHLPSVSTCWEQFYLATSKDDIRISIIKRPFFPITYSHHILLFLLFGSLVHTCIGIQRYFLMSLYRYHMTCLETIYKQSL